MEYALMLWEAGDMEGARRLFERGSGVPRSHQHPPLYDAWARLEYEAGNVERSEQLQSVYHEAMRQPHRLQQQQQVMQRQAKP